MTRAAELRAEIARIVRDDNATDAALALATQFAKEVRANGQSREAFLVIAGLAWVSVEAESLLASDASVSRGEDGVS